MRTTVATTGLEDLDPARPSRRRRWRRPARPGHPARTRARPGTAATIDSTRSATNPIPAAAAVEPVTVLPRNVMAAQAHRPSQASPASASQPAIGRWLEQDGGVEPAEHDRQDRRDRPRTIAITPTFAARNAPRDRRLGQHERGRAAIQFPGDRAHRQDDRRECPELGEVLPELADRIGQRPASGCRRSGTGRRPRP